MAQPGLKKSVWTPIDIAVVAALVGRGWQVKPILLIEERTVLRFEARFPPDSSAPKWLVRAPDVARLWDICVELEVAAPGDRQYRRFRAS